MTCVVSFSSSDLRVAADTRWTVIGHDEPHLQAAVILQRRLVDRTITAVSDLLESDAPLLDVAAEPAAARLGEGLPFFRGGAWTLPVDKLGPLVAAACDDLATGGAGNVARNVHACLEAGRVDLGSLLAVSLDRNQNAVREKALHESIAPDVLWLAAELAAAPAAHVAARQLAETGPTPLTDALPRWNRGYCPACGSWPAFSEQVDEQSLLRCSFCGHGWPVGPGCGYCGGGPDQVTWLKEEPAAPRRAQVCGNCGGYLKHLAREQRTPFELLPLEDLASTALDQLAAQQGYGRPPLPDFGDPLRHPCEADEPAR